MKPRIDPVALAAFLTAFGCALAFAIYTQHAWEDWYITYRSSKNLALGNGLVYNVGERFHTFTSVVGTLIPAALSWVTLNRSDDVVLWLFRILNCAVLGFSAVLLTKAAAKWFSFGPAIAILLGAFFVDTKTLDFSINGMETAYLVFSLSLFFYFISFYPLEALRVRLGIVWALLEYSRPDGIVYAVVFSTGMLLFLPDKKAVLRTVMISSLVGFLLFLPWLIFTLTYYGTIVPHSMVAKSALTGYQFADLSGRTLDYLKSYALVRAPVLEAIFSPPYSFWFDVPLILTIGKYLAFVASLLWVVPGFKPMARIASFSFFCFLLYLAVLTPFIYPWYIPGATLLALIALAFLLEAALNGLTRQVKYRPLVGWSISGAFLVYMLSATLISAHQFRRMEAIVERGNREQIGAWLKANSQSKQETVFVECAGYIGFYSGLKLYDFPGMTSDRMVRARKLLNTDDWLSLIKYLSPDWLVLRPDEFYPMQSEDRLFFQEKYTRRMDFNVSDKIEQLRFKPYKNYFLKDAEFIVFRKNDSPR
jgi:hypothetical protein